MPRPSKTSKDKDEIFDKVVDLLNKFSERSLKTDLANKTEDRQNANCSFCGKNSVIDAEIAQWGEIRGYPV